MLVKNGSALRLQLHGGLADLEDATTALKETVHLHVL